MRTAAALIGAAVAVGAALAGCSLTGLEQLAVKTCVRDEQCETLNRANGLGRDVCERFYCNPATRQCDMRVRSDEVCDGVDNDCDGLVDEGVLAPTAVTTAVGRVVPGSRVRFAQEGDACLVADPARSASFAPVAAPGGAEQGATAIPYQSQERSLFADNWWRFHRLQNGCDSSVAAGCVAYEAALTPAPASDQWFVAAVDTEGCLAGRLRLGLREGGALVVRGPNGLSNSWRGVDLTEPARCGGASRVGTAARSGVTRPAIQRLPGAPQALAAWLGDRATAGDTAEARGACGGPVANVEALVAHLAQGVSEGTPISWLTTSDSARPVTLGTTSGGGAPAMVSTGAAPRGYFVAFGDAAGGVALRFIGPATAPAPVTGTPPGLRDELHPTAPMPAPVAHTLARGGSGTADHVSMVALPAGGDSVTLALAWVEGCGAPTGTVYFATVRFDGASFRELARTLVATDASLTATSVALVPNAVSAGLSSHAVGDETRGWLVAYVTAGTLVARRVALGDGALLDEPAITLATGLASDGLAPLVLAPSGALPARAVWWSPARSAVETAALCGAPTQTPGGR